MKKILVTIVLAIFCLLPYVDAQKYFSNDAKMGFDASATASDKTDATTLKGSIVIDGTTGAVEMSALLKTLHFRKASTEKNFNENYLESDKYPKFVFMGTITELDKLKQNGVHLITLTGKLTLHGETKDVTANGAITVSGGTIESAAAQITTRFEDFKITIPSTTKEKIGTEAKFDISASLQPMKM
jgi:polyisoprenoid-binding protein YceI